MGGAYFNMGEIYHTFSHHTAWESEWKSNWKFRQDSPGINQWWAKYFVQNIPYFELRSSQGFDFQGFYNKKKGKILHIEKTAVMRKYSFCEEINFLWLSKHLVFAMF